VNIQSGAPFDITAGGDLYGTTLFNRTAGIRDRSQQAWTGPDKVRVAGPEPDSR